MTIDGRSVTLGPHALALFTALSETDAVLSRAELVDCLPEELDDHALEVAVSRLRRTLNVPGLITTVVKRGYRFNAVPLSVGHAASDSEESTPSRADPQTRPPPQPQRHSRDSALTGDSRSTTVLDMDQFNLTARH